MVAFLVAERNRVLFLQSHSSSNSDLCVKFLYVLRLGKFKSTYLNTDLHGTNVQIENTF